MINVDFSKVTGVIKPMHAVNNMPFVAHNLGQTDLYKKMQEAGIPYGRLHDTGGRYGGCHYVDVPNVFPNFDADETNPESYDFAFTDVLIGEMIAHGVKPFYRLGVTIENFTKIKAYNVYPPKDFAKWARICEGIIRHYNEGFADGFHYNIEYWEIWNEPDNFPDIKDNCMWKGTKEQYFELYKTASLYLKGKFPKLKIGGYASCGFYALTNTDVSATAHSSNRFEYFVEFFHEFMAFAKENKLPLDFFSWHSYADVYDNVKYAFYAREQLDIYGYDDAEIIFNEWNPGPPDRGTLKDAARIEAMMLAMQNSPTDMCMYYDAQVSSDYCGLFSPITYTAFKAYYSFYAFNILYQLKNAVSCDADDKNIFVCAAGNDENQAIIIVNRQDIAVTEKLNIVTDKKDVSFTVISEELDYGKTEKDLSNLILSPYEVCVVAIK